MKVIVIGGYPGAGKSTIVRKVVEHYESQGKKFFHERDGVVHWMEFPELMILGSYDKGEAFPGTDRFPMDVQPKVQAFLEELREVAYKDKVILFEGDRLFNGKMLDWLSAQGFERVLCIVEADQEVINQRRQTRSKQSETWRKGRQTKVDRIKIGYTVAHWLRNTTLEEQERSVQELIQEINGTWKRGTQHTLKDFWSKRR